MPRAAPSGTRTVPEGAAHSRYGRNVARDLRLLLGDGHRVDDRLLRRRRRLGLLRGAGVARLRRVGLLAVDGDVADRELLVGQAELDAEHVLDEHPDDERDRAVPDDDREGREELTEQLVRVTVERTGAADRA